MCDRCLPREDVLELLDTVDERDPIAVAKKRLLCYYQCVTKDMSPDDDSDEDNEDEDWRPLL